MANFARIIEGVAVDVSATPAEQFHPSLVNQFEPVPDQVRVGWKRAGDVWSAPEVPASQPEQAIYPVVGPIHFKMLFTAQERLKAKELRASDEMLNDFWELVEDPRTDVVNLGLQSVQQAVEYTLTVVAVAGVVVDVPARKTAILGGVLQ